MHTPTCITLNSFPFDYAFLIEMNRKIAVTIDYVKKRKKRKITKKIFGAGGMWGVQGIVIVLKKLIQHV